MTQGHLQNKNNHGWVLTVGHNPSNPSAPTVADNLDGLPTHLVLSRLSVPVLGIRQIFGFGEPALGRRLRTSE